MGVGDNVRGDVADERNTGGILVDRGVFLAQFADHVSVIPAAHLNFFVQAEQVPDGFAGDVVGRGAAGTQRQQAGQEAGEGKPPSGGRYGRSMSHDPTLADAIAGAKAKKEKSVCEGASPLP